MQTMVSEPYVNHVPTMTGGVGHDLLKRFYQYLHKAEGLGALDEVALFTRYRDLLAQAYQDFTTSNAVTEKVFKVFQDATGQQTVSVSKLRESLAERRAA